MNNTNPINKLFCVVLVRFPDQDSSTMSLIHIPHIVNNNIPLTPVLRDVPYIKFIDVFNITLLNVTLTKNAFKLISTIRFRLFIWSRIICTTYGLIFILFLIRLLR